MKEFIKQIVFFFVLIILISSLFMMFKMDNVPEGGGSLPGEQNQANQ